MLTFEASKQAQAESKAKLQLKRVEGVSAHVSSLFPRVLPDFRAALPDVREAARFRGLPTRNEWGRSGRTRCSLQVQPKLEEGAQAGRTMPMFAYATRSPKTAKPAVGASSPVAKKQPRNHPWPDLLQAKLAVSNPADAHEQEADRAADEVMRMADPKPGVTTTSAVRVQRKCPTCPEELEIASRATIDDEEEKLQAKCEDLRTETVSASVEDAIHGLDGRGRPLSDSVRAFMEPRFNANFGNVRVHTDAGAATLARDVKAHAFTVGRNIVFAQGRYEPASDAGKHILAHELSHVVQQGGAPLVPSEVGTVWPVRRLDRATRPLVESNAEHAAYAVQRLHASQVRIQRRELPGEDFPWYGVIRSSIGAWFRRSPGKSAKNTIRGLPQGTEVKVTGVSGLWLQVEYGGTTGYVHKDMIEQKFETEARGKVTGVCGDSACLKQSGCNKSLCEKEAAVIAEKYVSRVNTIRKPSIPNVGDRRWGWLCYEWAGLLTREFKNLKLNCWKINWVGIVGTGGSLEHNYVFVSLADITPAGTEPPKRECGMILDPWRTGDPIVYDVSWSWHKWNYIHDPATDKGKADTGAGWYDVTYPPPWTPTEPAPSPTIKTP